MEGIKEEHQKKKIIHIVDGDKIPASKIRLSIGLFISLISGICIVASVVIAKYYAFENAIQELKEEVSSFNTKYGTKRLTSGELATPAFDADCEELHKAIKLLTYIEADKNCN